MFLGESEAGARVRISGREIELTPEEFDMGRDAVVRIEAARKAEEKQAASLLPATSTAKKSIPTISNIFSDEVVGSDEE